MGQSECFLVRCFECIYFLLFLGEDCITNLLELRVKNRNFRLVIKEEIYF